MLKTRVITAIVILAVLLSSLYLGSVLLINILCTVGFAAACWESGRLFGHRYVIPTAVVLAALFFWTVFNDVDIKSGFWGLGVHGLACLALIVLFIPSLKFELPKLRGRLNLLFSASYLISIFACFLAIRTFFASTGSEPLFLLSVMALVWVADSAAYFFGKAFGRHKLAPVISPGKSWEGAIGGWLCVLLFGVMCTQVSFLSFTFPNALKHALDWSGFFLLLTLLTAVGVIGDLIESQLKRRAKVKDSSHLLPGHGGVLDRIDSLIFFMPMANLIHTLMWVKHFGGLLN